MPKQHDPTHNLAHSTAYDTSIFGAHTRARQRTRDDHASSKRASIHEVGTEAEQKEKNVEQKGKSLVEHRRLCVHVGLAQFTADQCSATNELARSCLAACALAHASIKDASNSQQTPNHVCNPSPPATTCATLTMMNV